MKLQNKIKFIHIHESELQVDIKVVSSDLSLDRLMDSFKEFCLSVGYAQETVNKVQWVEEDDETID